MNPDPSIPSRLSSLPGRRTLSTTGTGMAVCPSPVPDITASITSRRNLESSEPLVSEDELANEKVTSFLLQERSHPPEPTAPLLEVQLGPKKERHSLSLLEKLEAAKRIRPSPSSPEVHPSALSASQPTVSTLRKGMVATRALLQKLSESSTKSKAEFSKMHQDVAKVSMGKERWELMRKAQDGDRTRARAETWESALLASKTPLGSEEKHLLSPKPEMEESQEWQASATAPAAKGEEVEQPCIRKKRRLPPLRHGAKRPQYPEDLILSRKERDLQLCQSICLSQQEEKGNDQSSDNCASISSAFDILLATVSDLKSSTTATTTNATAAKLITILQEHRSSMKDKVQEIVESICVQISSIPDGQAKRAAMNVVILLAEEYSWDVVASLLKYSLPCDSSVSEMWRSLCSVPETSTTVLWQVLKELKQRPRLPTSSDSSPTDRAQLAPLAAARALGEMLKIFTCIGAMQGFFPQVFLALLTQIHFLIRLPKYTEDSRNERNSLSVTGHVRFAVETLKMLLAQDRNEMALKWMDKTGCWALLSSPEHHVEGILLLARALVMHTRHHVTGMLAEVFPKLCTEDEERTLTARALFAGFLCSKSVVELLPFKTILSKLEDWQMDPRLTVRWLSLHGSGNLALHGQKAKYLKAVVSMILVGLKEPDERPVKEALRGLGNVLSCHQGRECLGSTCVRIAEKLQPLMTDARPLGKLGRWEVKVRDQVRSAAIGLFGKLLLGVNRRHKSQMQQQVLSNTVPLLLHLQDPCHDVLENCEWTLARCNNFLGWKLLEEITVLAHYDSQQALSQICKCLVQRYPDQVPTFLTHTLEYLKSPAAPLRRAASMLTGFLVYYMDAKIVSREVMSSLLTGLSSLADDPDPSVSSAASVSLLQVKQACSHAAMHDLPHTLRRVFCYVSKLENEKPLFEDSPFKRKRSLEGSNELCFKL